MKLRGGSPLEFQSCVLFSRYLKGVVFPQARAYVNLRGFRVEDGGEPIYSFVLVVETAR